MRQAFTIARSRLSHTSAPDLRKEIDGYTGSESETASILRSIDRFGDDLSIDSYEVNPTIGRGTRLGRAKVSWTVRAHRV